MQVVVQTLADTKQAQAQYAALTAQVKAYNKALADSALIPVGGTPEGYRAQMRMMNQANRAYSSTLASTGQFRVEQMKLNDAVERHTELLQKQKLGFRQTFGREGRGLMKSIYREQLALNQAAFRTMQGSMDDAKIRTTLAIPTEVHKSWDTLNNRIGFFRHQLASSSRQLINWGKNTQWAGRQLMVGISMPVAAFGAAAGVMAYKVDKELTRIQKVYDTTADANNTSAEGQIAVMKELEQVRLSATETGVTAAKEYGAAITDTLQVQAELAATGQKGAELQKNTNEIMRISMLGEIDHATSTKALIALQSTLGATTKETADMFNYMNAIENATSLQTADFAEAIPRALAPMKEMSAEGSTATEVLQNMSVLMVAMKERGIDAGEGANAIKAMMQRLYRPSRQVREEWQKLVGIDPLAIIQESGGDIMQILPQISKAVAGLSQPSKIKALAGLFGTYQVTRMSQMLEGFEDMESGIGQTTRALEVGEKGWEQWAKTAEQEQERIMGSASGKFKRAWEVLRAELAIIGEPFLEIGAAALTAFSKLASMFNAMPGWAKKAAIIGAVMAAMVGPIVMLVGLFANFAGNIGVFMASLLRLASNFELVSKSQMAAKVSAKLAEAGFEREAMAANVLTKQMDALTLATTNATKAQYMLSGADLPLGMSIASGSMHGPAAPTREQWSSIYASQLAKTDKRGQTQFRGPRGFLTAGDAAMLAMHTEALETNKKITAEKAEQAKKNTAANRAYAKTNSLLGGGAVAMGAMGAAMTANMVIGGKTTENIMQWTIIGSMVVPAAMTLVPLMKSSALWAGKYAASMTAAAMATMKGASGRGMIAGLAGGARGFAALLGPVGLATAAITTAGFVAYKIHKRNQEMLKQQIKQQKALSDTTKNWADALGLAAREQKKLTVKSPMDTAEASVGELADRFKGDKQNKAVIAGYKDADAAEKEAIAMKQYATVLNVLGGNATDAQRALEILFRAAGDGAIEATTKAQEFARKFGSAMSSQDMAVVWSSQINSAVENMRQEIPEKGKAIGKALADSIANQTSLAGQNAQLGAFTKGMEGQWDRLFNNLDSEMQRFWRSAGVNGGAEMQKMVTALQEGNAKGDLSAFENIYGPLDDPGMMLALDQVNQMLDNNDSVLSKMFETEKAVVKELANQLGIEENIATMTQLTATWEWKKYAAQKASSSQATEILRQRLTELSIQREMLGVMGDSTWGEAAVQTDLQAANELLVARGLGEVNTLQQAFNALLGRGAGKAEDLKNEVKAIPKHVNIGLNFTGDQIKSIWKSGMEGVTNDLADRASSTFDSRMSAAMDSAQAGWDKRIEGQQAAAERASDALDRRQENAMNALERRHENESVAFEKRWDRRRTAVERYYDRRINIVENAIKAEEKAEEIRQRIFEAEQTRLERLAESANKTIDFNVALRTGDFDEAAKIRNDMQASAEQWALGDAAAGSGAASQARVDRLQGQADSLGAQRDNALKLLDQREADERRSMERRQQAQKRHLERMQQAEKAHLDKVQKQEAASLKRRADADMAANRRRWEHDKRTLDSRLELFKSYTGRNQKDLERWMKEVGLTYDDFGLSVKRKGTSWSEHFRNTLKAHVRQAGNQIASDNMWEAMGAREAGKMLNGMGFRNMNEFKTFIMTGNLPKDFGQRPKATPQSGGGRSAAGVGPNSTLGGITRHEGGWVDGSAGSRKGVARNLSNLHPSEVNATLRRKEFVVNEDAAAKYPRLLESLNSGKTIAPDSRRNIGEGVGGGAGGMAALLSVAMMRGLATGAMKGIRNRTAAKIRENRAAAAGPGGTFGLGAAGKYGDRFFNAQQLKHAATIANVGSSMGMSKRDIQIGIMTAITESGLVNVNYGDRDSLGLFQQRPSQGWGTPEQVTNPTYASRKFFSVLKGVVDRGGMSPWAAAQAVQRSAFSDGSNYRTYWDEAVAIYNRGLTKSKTGFGANTTQFAQGAGGWHRPSKPGKGWSNTHDYRNGMGSPLYAHSDGVVVDSRAITSGGSPGNGLYGGKYRSYGETIAIRGSDGRVLRYAHLNPGQRYVRKGQQVKGGALIGRSGMTGNATGPHTHFDIDGNYNAYGYLRAHGIGLRGGGYTMSDGLANLHKEEVVISPERTRKLYAGIDQMEANFASGSKTEYNVKVDARGTDLDEDAIVRKTITALKRIESRKPQRRKSDT